MDIYFRYLTLDKMQAVMLEREIGDASYFATQAPKVFIGAVPLITINIEAIMTFFIRQNINAEDCDICVEISDAEQQLALPATVNQMLKQVDCPIVIKAP